MEAKMNVFQKTTPWLKQVSAAIVLVLGMCMIYACSQTVDEGAMEQKFRVQVNVSPSHFKLENGDMDAGARSRSISDAATRLSFAVFDAEGTLVGSVIHQTSSDGAFGTVELELYPGSYRMVAVAHSGAGNADIESVTSVALPGTTFTDTFSDVQDLTVNPNEDCNFNMTLPRATSAFILRMKDTPPANAKEVEVVVNSAAFEPSSLSLDPDTRLAANNWKQTRIIPVAELSQDTPVYFISQYLVAAVTVKATAYDTDGEVIISHTINNVTFTPNQKTIASGYFFQSSSSGMFALETAWGADKPVDY